MANSTNPLSLIKEALEANNQWHLYYDDHDNYIGSHLEDLNVSALKLLSQLDMELPVAEVVETSVGSVAKMVVEVPTGTKLYTYPPQIVSKG